MAGKKKAPPAPVAAPITPLWEKQIVHLLMAAFAPCIIMVFLGIEAGNQTTIIIGAIGAALGASAWRSIQPPFEE